MGTWSNPTHSWNDDDMDSNGKRLRVAGTASGSYWQAQIESDHDDRQALLILGKAAFRETEIRGTIKPNASLNSLDINAESDSDPNVRIGSGTGIGAGNQVFLLGKNISIGGETPQPGIYRVAISGPVNVSQYIRVPWVEADTELQSPRLEPVVADGILDIGTRQAQEVLIGRDNHFTVVMGRLVVHGFVEMADGLLVSGGNISTNGTISSQSDISAQGNATVQGKATAQGNITAQGTVTAASFQTSGGLAVGGESRFDRTAQFNERVVVHGETYHENAVRMQGQPIIMGGGGQDEVRMICGQGDWNSTSAKR